MNPSGRAVKLKCGFDLRSVSLTSDAAGHNPGHVYRSSMHRDVVMWWDGRAESFWFLLKCKEIFNLMRFCRRFTCVIYCFGSLFFQDQLEQSSADVQQSQGICFGFGHTGVCHQTSGHAASVERFSWPHKVKEEENCLCGCWHHTQHVLDRSCTSDCFSAAGVHHF